MPKAADIAKASEQPVRATTRGFSTESLEELLAWKQEPTWIRDRRLKAWSAYQDLPMPTGTDEAWRRTDVKAFPLEGLAPFAGSSLGQEEAVTQVGQAGAIRIEEDRAGLFIQQDSEAVHAVVDPDLAAQGVILTSLEAAAQEHTDLIRAHFMTEGVRPEDGKFAALHGTFWSGGTLLYLPPGLSCETPFRIRYLLKGQELAVFPHTLVVASAGSRVAVIEEYLGGTPEGMNLSCAITEVLLDEGAEVEMVTLQNWSQAVGHLALHRARSGRNSRLRWLTASLGTGITKADVESYLEGPGAESELLGAHFLDGTQHLDLTTLLEHAAPHTQGNVLFKGAGKGRSRSVFRGLIHIAKTGQQTSSFLEDHNLLLSQEARADSIPALEIEAHDVQCKHGATVGQVDEDQLFYLMTRGLERELAIKMVVAGFFEPVLKKIPMEGVREYLRDTIVEKIEAD